MNFYHTNLARELSWYVSIAFQETEVKSVDERFHEKKSRDNLLKYANCQLRYFISLEVLFILENYFFSRVKKRSSV